MYAIPAISIKSGNCRFGLVAHASCNRLLLKIRFVLSLKKFKAILMKVAFYENYIHSLFPTGFLMCHIWHFAVVYLNGSCY